jgi:hypothetical protein
MARKLALRASLACAAFAIATLGPYQARPARAVIYGGAPNLALAVALVKAGSGPHGFSSHTLFAHMFGAKSAAENSALKERYGFDQLAEYFGVMDFTIGDILRIAEEHHITLPAADPTASASPAALAASLYRAGIIPDGRYDVGYMIERLMTHPLHHELMRDIDSRFKPEVNASFHEILTTVVVDAAHK